MRWRRATRAPKDLKNLEGARIQDQKIVVECTAKSPPTEST